MPNGGKKKSNWELAWELRKKRYGLTPLLPLPPEGQSFTTEGGKKYTVMPNGVVIEASGRVVGEVDLSQPIDYGEKLKTWITHPTDAPESLSEIIWSWLKEPTRGIEGATFGIGGEEVTKPRWEMLTSGALEQVPYFAIGTGLQTGKIMGALGGLKVPKVKTPKVEIPVIENRMPTIQETMETLPKLPKKTDPEKATIAWNVLTKEKAQDLARIDMDVVYINDSPFRINPKTGLVENVIPKSPKYKPYIQDIMEFPNRYNLTAAQRAEIDLITQKILPQQLERELAAGVKVRPIKLKPEQRYFPREVTALEGQAKLEIRRGVSRRPGTRPSSFRQRWYSEVLEGMAAGKKYSADYRALTEARLRAGNKAIADKMLAEYLKPLGKLPFERMPLETRTQYMGASRQFAGIRNFQKVVNRAVRGEKIPEATIQAQERRFPELGGRLRETLKIEKGITRKGALKGLIAEAKRLEPELQNAYWAARRQAVREMARARVPIVGKEGTINHAALQGRIFPIETSDPVNILIRKFTTDNQILAVMAQLNAVGRMGQTTFDPGFTFIQGLLVLANNPKFWGQAFWISLKTLANPKFMARFGIEKQATRLLITTHGGAPFARSEYTEAARAGGWLARIPKAGKGFERFGTFFESFIDAARIYLVEGKVSHLTSKLGRPLTRAELTDIVVTTDHMVGISSLTRYGASRFQEQLASNALYAPRYFVSFVSLLGRAFQGGAGGNIAREALAKFLFAIPTFMSAVALALGQKERVIPTKDKPIPVMFDPRSGELMTVEIGGTHMGLGGVWIAGFRLLGSLTRAAQDNPKDFISIDPHENPLLRYPYGRASPVAGAIIDVTTGHNYIGERLDTPLDYLREAVDKTFPFWIAGAITDVPPSGWEKGMAELWGLRAWEVQYREQAEDYANQHIKDMPPEMVMPDQQEKFAKGELKYKDLNNEQRAWLLNNFADYAEAEEKRREEVKRKGADPQVADAYVRELLDAPYYADLKTLATGVLNGDVTIAKYQDQAEYLRRIRSGQYQYREEILKWFDEDQAKEIDKWIEANTRPEDKIFNQYMELRGSPPKVNGVPNWDMWKKNLDAFLYHLDPNMKAYVERRRDDWINNLPDEETQKVERLIMDCEDVLDKYYSVAEGKNRLDYRTGYPDVDAKLLILGRVTTLKTPEAIPFVKQIMSNYGITSYSDYPTYIFNAILKVEGAETTPPTWEEEWEERKRKYGLGD